ncbi:head decoration protein [Methylobacterium sp. MA0201]|uniref:head decoration protein n=1 Tax=Methylobacterium alsaeris TaxID=3344826 RepID=UPI00375666B4
MYSTELPHDGEFIVWTPGRYSFDVGMVDASADLRTGTVLKLVAGVYEPMATGDTQDLVAGVLRDSLAGQGAGATQKASILARFAEVTDEGGRMVYPAGGADAAHVAADKAACQAGLRRLGIINR